MGDRRERKEPPKVDGMFTLKVDGISQYTTKEMLEEKFSPFGEVGDVYIPRKHGSSDNRGYAFVRFLVEADGLRAMDELNGQDIDGKPVTIAEAKQPRPENPRAAMREREGGRFRDRDFRDRDRDRDYRSDRDRGGYRDRDSRRDSRDRDYGRDRRDYGRDRSRDRDYAPPRRDYHDSYDAPRYDAPRSDYRSRSRSPRGRY